MLTASTAYQKLRLESAILRRPWIRHLYKTSDYGKTWTPVVVQTARACFAHVIKKILSREPAISRYEFGLWVYPLMTAHWAQVTKAPIPQRAGADIVVHARESDLVVAIMAAGFGL